MNELLFVQKKNRDRREIKKSDRQTHRERKREREIKVKSPRLRHTEINHEISTAGINACR